MGFTPGGRHVCEGCNQPHRHLAVHGTAERDLILCPDCRRKQREKDKKDPRIRRVGFPLTPEAIAIRLEKMRQGQKDWLARRKAIRESKLLQPGEEVRGKINSRWWEVLIMHCSGYDVRDIARIMGYSSHAVVEQIIRNPRMSRYIEEIRQEQLHRVLSGAFGVRAQAKAAAPKVMDQMIHNATKAEKPADQVKAGQTVLQVAGELVQRSETNHVHVMLKDLTDAELIALRDRGIWPDRYKSLVDKLGLGAQQALPAPEG